MLELRHIYKTYHNKRNDYLALDDLNLSIKDNTGLIFILGPSGSGKSTLLNIIADKDKDFKGERIIDGNLVYIGQDFRLMEAMSLYDNLAIIKNDPKAIRQFIKLLDLEEVADKKVYKLSNGQKKRVELIKALLLNPDILLLDELCSALDHDSTIKVMTILKSLSASMCIIMVSHDEDLALNYATRILRIAKGKIAKDEKIKELNYRPLKKYKLKKDFKAHINLTFKDFKSRLGYYSLLIMALLLCTVSIYTAINLYNTTKGNNSYLNAFKYGRNIIESSNEAHIGTSQINNCYYDDRYNDECYETTRYDVYDPKDVDEFLSSHPEVMSVSYSWSQNRARIYEDGYNFISYYPEYLGSFANYYYLSEYTDAMLDETFWGLQAAGPVIDDVLIFNEAVNMIPDSGPFITPENEILEFRAAENIDEESISQIEFAEYTLTDDFDRNIYAQNSVSFNYLVHGYDVPIVYGNMPENDNEMIIDLTLADFLLTEWGADEYTDLLDKEVSFSIFRDEWNYEDSATNDINLFMVEQLPFAKEYYFLPSISFKISGISSLMVDGEKNVYFASDYIDNPFIDMLTEQIRSDEYQSFHDYEGYNSYHLTDEYGDISEYGAVSLKYGYEYHNDFNDYHCLPEEELGKVFFDNISFTLVPGSDYESFLEDCINFFNPQYNTFNIHGNVVGDDANLFYKNLNTFYPFIIVLCILIVFIPLLMAIMMRKVENKEKDLLKIYHYNVNIIYILRYGFFFILTLILALALIYLLVLPINHYALNYNYVSFINYNPLLIILITFISVAINALIRRWVR